MYQALLLVNNGLSPDKVAEDFPICCSRVYLWIKLSEKKGLLHLE
jgi:transposase